MSSERLREIRERLEGTIYGPWEWYWRVEEGTDFGDVADCGVFCREGTGIARSICRAPRYETQEQWEKTGEFIASAPSDIRWLLERVEELEEHLELSREESAKWEENYREAVNPGSQNIVEFCFTTKKSPSVVIRPEGSND